MSFDLTNPIFNNEEAARAYFEAFAGLMVLSALIAASSTKRPSLKASRIVPASISAMPVASRSP